VSVSGVAKQFDGFKVNDECSQVLSELYEYLDSTDDPTRWGRLEGHLDRCPPCVRAFAFETRLRKLVATKCRDEPPASLVHKVVVAVRLESVRGSTDR
jgi:mycothiol system anti-sigma-R factor